MKKRWEVIGKQGTAIWEGDEIVAKMNNPRTNHRNARRNAVLMSSAPELLETLQRVVKFWDSISSDGLPINSLHASAKELIANLPSSP